MLPLPTGSVGRAASRSGYTQVHAPTAFSTNFSYCIKIFFGIFLSMIATVFMGARAHAQSNVRVPTHYARSPAPPRIVYTSRAYVKITVVLY